jgi:hypothetical protein
MIDKPEYADFYGWDKFLKYIYEDFDDNDEVERMWELWIAAYKAGVNQ